MTFEPDPDRDILIRSKEDAWREEAEYDFDLDMAYEALEEQVRETIEGQAVESVRAYLGTYGDAVWARVEANLADARSLLSNGYAGPAITLASTAIELTIRYLVIRPLVQGAFLSDDWAAILTDAIVRDRPGEARAILPAIVAASGLNLDDVTLPDGAVAWGTFTGVITPARNAYVHRAEPVSDSLAARAIECAETLLAGLVGPMASLVGMAWPGNPWHSAYVVAGRTVRSFAPQDPFVKLNRESRPRGS
jgi:hypothetical protein